MIRARSATMVNLRSSFSVFVVGIGLCIAPQVQGQNPPMNCTPDGIIEVCTAADSGASAIATEPVPVAAPAAKVTYKAGLLTISAENVSLSDVLHEVSAKTGAAIDFPNGSATEPVFTNIGPGPVRDILATLLNGTKFNYVMLGSENSSNTLDKIVLTQGDQPAEVAQNSVPGVPRKVQSPTAPPQSAEERTAAFMAEAEAGRAVAMQRAQEKFADLAARGLLRTPAPDSASSSPSADPPAADSPAPDPPNQ
jgi:hypothetical protein